MDTNKGKEPLIGKIHVSADSLIKTFNEMCHGWGKIRSYNSFWLSENAMIDFANIQRDPAYQTLEGWKKVFEEVQKSPFLQGKGKKFFVCTLPWLLKSDNFQVLMGGGYEGKEDAPEPSKAETMALNV